jgi:trans-aconitate methyltransferase
VLDAGCGVGHALRELHREYPGARLEGIERSRPLRWACAMRAPFARLHGGDLWAARWSAYDLVYVFQRPDTMARIAQKAREELPAGAWLVSLEFEVPGWQATASWEAREARKVWAYRMGAAGSLPVSQRPSSR